MSRLFIQLRAPRDREQLPATMAMIEAAFADSDVPGDRMQDVQLIVEELVCNTMDHAAADREVDLEVGIELGEGGIVLDYRDNGAAYDPLAQSLPDLDADIEDRPIGGLGIHLVRTLSRDASYRRDDGWNTLRIVLDAILAGS